MILAPNGMIKSYCALASKNSEQIAVTLPNIASALASALTHELLAVRVHQWLNSEGKGLPSELKTQLPPFIVWEILRELFISSSLIHKMRAILSFKICSLCARQYTCLYAYIIYIMHSILYVWYITANLYYCWPRSLLEEVVLPYSWGHSLPGSQRGISWLERWKQHPNFALFLFIMLCPCPLLQHGVEKLLNCVCHRAKLFRKARSKCPPPPPRFLCHSVQVQLLSDWPWYKPHDRCVRTHCLCFLETWASFRMSGMPCGTMSDFFF